MTSATTLRAELLNEFQRELFDASVRTLLDVENPLRLNHFSSSFRELVRHVFDELAPDDDVKRCSWFVPDATSSSGVTRRHRASYVVHGGLSPNYAVDVLGIAVAAEITALVTAVNRLSRFIHVNPSTFGRPPDEVTEFVGLACDALRDVLISARAAREALAHGIELRVQRHVIDVAIGESIMEVDELATHHSIENVYVDMVDVVRVRSAEIEYLATGSLDVELQWGSNSDVAKGDGALGDDSYPLRCTLVSPVTNPEDYAVVEGSLQVDTSSWYQDGDA